MKQLLPFSVAAIVQFQVDLGNPSVNIEKVTALIEQYHPEPGTLIVLPELWAAGFDYSRTGELAEQTPEILDSVQELAARHEVVIAGSLPELLPNEKKPRNTIYFTDKDGVIGKISKQFLFSFWQEDRFYQPGYSCQELDAFNGKMGGMVCYDLRFPEIAREQAFNGAKVIVVSAQWPKARRDHWLTLLRARAIENQVFVVAANGCGITGDTEMGGWSVIINPAGEILQQAEDSPEVKGVKLDQRDLGKVRQHFCPPGERPWRQRDERKILSKKEIAKEIASMRQQGAKVAFTNGCFDILHAGHVSYLEKARATADCLIVGLNSDSSIRAIKGPDRPVNNELDRARVLASLGCVDFIVLFQEETPIDLITTFLPDVLIKGADWEEEDIVGGNEVKAAGGRIERIAFEYTTSTTKLISTIQKTGTT